MSLVGRPLRRLVRPLTVVGVALVAAGCARSLAPAATTTSDAARGAIPAGPLRVDRPLTAAEQAWVDRALAGLSLRDRVAQLVTVWVLGDYTNANDSSFLAVRRWIERDHVGGVVMSLGSPLEVAAKVNAMQRIALASGPRIPLLVSSDLEPGLGRFEGGVFTLQLWSAGTATVLPTNMAIGAGGEERDAFAAGQIIGREARAAGVHVAFAPTVDVNNNPANPVINVRSFGEDAASVARLSAAFVRGVQSEGTAAVAKHFPGHGDTDTDSHLALPVVRSDRARLDSVELVPFRAAIAAGVAGVMTAHIALPAVEGDSTPATLSPRVMTGLLRDTLNFRGTVFTDAMTMEGVGKGYTVDRSAPLAVLAGDDVLLMPTDVPRAIDGVLAAVERGEISRERIDAAARRVLELKARTGAVARPFVSLDSLREVIGAPAHWATARGIAERAVTLLRDSTALVPSGGRTLAAVVYAPDNEPAAGQAFVNELRAGARVVREARISPRTAQSALDSLADAVRAGGAERLVVMTYTRTLEGGGRLAIPAHVNRWIDAQAAAMPTIVVAGGNPYVIRQFPRVTSYLVTYGRGDALERAAARAVVGRAAITGRAPVTLPGLFARGDGLRRAAGGTASAASAATPLGTPLGSSATASAAERVLAPMREVLDRAVADSAFPGAVAVVGDRNGVVATYAAGRVDWAPDAAAPDERTLWDLASLTKVVGMTSAIAQLVAERKVDVDAPVQRYLPEWAGPGKDRVLVRHLLSHASGLPAWRPLYKEAADRDGALALVLATPLDTAPAARFVYSDLNAILLGRVVERVSGLPLDQYLRRRVFEPLGMVDTRYNPPADTRGRAAPTERDPWRQRHLRGEVHDENAFALGGVSGHAGLFSTAADLARFARAYLNGGTLDGRAVFDAATLARFTRVVDSAVSRRALGWETPTGANSAGTRLSERAFGHTGFTGTSLWIDPDRGTYVILLSNRVNPTRMNTKIGRVRVALMDGVTTAIDAAPTAAPRPAPSNPPRR